jgi:hypothetical protein
VCRRRRHRGRRSGAAPMIGLGILGTIIVVLVIVLLIRALL